ncbi:hypothetical protein EDD16DRAFT_1576722 [Pisolithus croceorrhizus]|nr:hypothetical protein EDD16DRAFT_1576722 [Pisolithus croceorrhizus]KAI6129588.1 hypothetical protein EV401DRAFT_1928037 [Pisolithus croceorrhizus]
MVTVLGFPFELFLYRCVRGLLYSTTLFTNASYTIYLFIAALIAHLSINAATLQIAVAVSIMGFVIISLSLYWLITKPSGERPVPCEGMTRRGQV